MMKNYKNKEWLKEKYLDEKLSTMKIAELCSLNSHVTILNWLGKHEIKCRSLSEAKKIYHPKGMLGKHHSEKTKQKMKIANKGRGTGRKLSETTRRKISEIRKNSGVWLGEKNPNWKDGVSFEPYGREFSKDLRNEIRKRDKFECQECGRKEHRRKHSVHHIDFSPQNNRPENLILLCALCHMKIHQDKEDL